MKKSEILARIEMLERRIAVLEARPVVYPPISVPSIFGPFTTGTPAWVPPHTITSTGPISGIVIDASGADAGWN